MLRTPVLAAGGIVLRRGDEPRLAVVRMRKRGDWVLPKGKLERGETPRQAAEREAWEETGHAVAVHEFVGTLAYESGGRSKVVHFWRMEAEFEPNRALMKDIVAVEWLSLDDAVGRLSRSYEQAFLSEVGPYVLEQAARKASPPSRLSRPRDVQPAEELSVPAPVAAHTAETRVTELRHAPPLALEQPVGTAEAPPTLLGWLRRWLSGDRDR
ncbi:NUDIX hydrolase [Rhodopseudomonas sp. B29]|uniref:NUDIX hydrolase n=1 Tax=Rhodopseudomonas sp. B29 TaxID=95607 RepID=UPI0009FE0CD7|nr:NUDIX hydrolase [Rhodopseudomonas sp. B29]